MTTITLINPPQFSGYPQPPLGLASIAAVLERQGYHVTLLDANAMNLPVSRIPTLTEQADVIGITAMTPSINSAMEIAGLMKRQRGNRPVILGGAHGTLLPEETLQTAPGIDVVVRGEGEQTIVELMVALREDKGLEAIGGISYRAPEGIRHNEPQADCVDLDQLPFPAYHLLKDYRYHPHPPHGIARPFMALVTSRGCPYRCAYCSKPIFGTRFNGRSPELVLDELTYLVRDQGTREIAFYDDVFTLNKKRTTAICQGIIERGLSFHWTCETRVNLVDQELLNLMKQAGCFAVAYGIESASPDILKLLHKDISVQQVIDAVKMTRIAGLEAIGYFMVGSPGETPATIRETIALSKRVNLDFAQYSITMPFPSTELYDLYVQQGFHHVDWKHFVYAGKSQESSPVFESASLSRQDINRWVARAYRSFYLRPGYFFQRLRRVSSVSGMMVNIRGLIYLMRGLFRG